MPDAPDPYTLTPRIAAEWFSSFSETVRQVAAELTELDRKAGDGDFGTNLAEGMDGVWDALAALPEGYTADAPVAAAAGVFLDDVGGTSGPLFGLLFQEMAAALAGESRPGVPELAAGASAGAAAVQRVGEAQPGDKTMVDALKPAADALTACPDGTSVHAALQAAAVAAHRGAQATADLRARRGRASYTGARAEGVPDPGALAVSLLFACASGPLTSLRDLP